MELEFSELVIWEQLEVYWRQCLFFFGVLLDPFFLCHTSSCFSFQLLVLPQSWTKVCFIAKVPLRRKWWGSVGEYKSMRGNQTVVPGRRWLSINPTVMGEGNCWSWWWTSLHSPFFYTFLGHWFLIAWCRLLIVVSVYRKLSSNIPSSLAQYLLQVYATISRKSKHNILMMISCSIIPWHTAVGRLYSSECQRRKCSLRSHL